ncbi:MAG: hypothetical protein J6T63_06440 [Bacteroidales bacterium]|nr:hypothetical protein [Bacteroidales bacterium]
MKRFFVKFIITMSIPLMILVLIEAVIRGTPNSYKHKLSIIENNKNDVELLIMGSSHANNGLNPHLFPIKTINCAMGGQGITIDDFLLKRYIGQMPNLKYIILPVDYPTLFLPDAVGSPDRYMYYNVYYKFEPNIFSLDNYEIFHPHSVKAKLWALFRDDFTIYDDSLGFHGINDLSFTSDASETVKWQTTENISNKTIDKNICAFSNIAKMTEINGIKLIIITMPVHKSFYELSDTAQMKFTRNTIQNIMIQHNNCIYLDYYATLFNDSCYSDATHLNIIGADSFTKLLVHDLDSMRIFEK